MGGKKVLRRMNFDAGKNTAALSATASLASAVPPVQSALIAGASLEAGAARRTNLRPLASLLPYVKRYRWRVIAALGALILAALTTLVVPIAVRRMIDFGFTARGLALIDNYFLVMIGVGGGVGAGERAPLLPRHHARRAHRRRFARRRVRACDLALGRFLRRGENRRGDLAAHRRYHADQGRGRQLGFGRVAQRRAVCRRQRDDGRQ